MIGALIYLQVAQWRNRVISRLRRLRKPQYLIGSLLAVAYFFFFFIRPFGSGPAPDPGPSGVTDALRPVVEIGAALVVALVVLGTWLLPSKRAFLDFTESEVAFLFPAPVSRSALVHFRLIRTQVGLGFSALIMAVLTWRMARDLGAGTLALGWWVVMGTLELHRQFAGFIRTRLMNRGLGNGPRRALVLLLVAVALVIVRPQLTTLWNTLPDEERAEPAKVLAALEHAADRGPLAVLLAPFRLVARPLAAPDPAAFLQRLAPALGLLVLLYLAAARTAVAFEEATVEWAAKRSRLVEAARAGNWHLAVPATGEARAPFRLRPTGWRWVAFCWKNMISTRNLFSPQLLAILLATSIPLVVVLLTTSRAGDLTRVFGAMCLAFALMASLVGPDLLRFDLRQDLPLAGVLKTYPIAGWQLVLGEVAAPVLFLTAGQCLLLGIGITLMPLPAAAAAPVTRAALWIAAALVSTPFNATVVLIHNAAALLFPAWIRLGPAGSQGFEAIGQRLLLMLGQMLTLALGLLPPLLLAVPAFLGLRLLLDWRIALPLATAVGAGVLAIEAALIIRALGDRFERMDVSEETAP